MNDIIIRPVITERSMSDAGKNKYTFLVDRKADKPAIKKAIEKKFTVTVLAVFTIITKGKSIRAGLRRLTVNLSPLKKAIVTVKNGQKIALFDVKS